MTVHDPIASRPAGVALDDLGAYTIAFLQRTAKLDDRAFLAAQFDAGLAWVHYRPGEGGLGLPRSSQQLVEDLLDAHGRRIDWIRNPMGIRMFSPALSAFGTFEQRNEHLRPIFTAEELWCQLFSEPGSGSDLAALSTRATRHGDTWVVNGQKTWTSWADIAHRGVLLARTDPDAARHAGLSAFIVDMAAPGVEVRPLRELTGYTEFSDVYFTDLELARTALIGRPGDGWRVAITMLMNERIAVAGDVEARGSGPIGEALEVWGGRQHGDQQRHDRVMRDRLAALWIESEVLRLHKLQILGTTGIGEDPGPAGSLVKLAAAELEQRLQNFLVELAGPTGALAYDYGAPDDVDDSGGRAEKYLRAVARTIAGGTSEVMRNIIAERLLGLPGDLVPDRNLPWTEFQRLSSGD